MIPATPLPSVLTRFPPFRSNRRRILAGEDFMADPAETPPADTASGQAPPADHAPASPTPLFICPYCGGPTPDQPRCAQCSGLLDPLSRQATQNAMGPWFIRDEQQPHRPGCSYETILALIARGKVTLDSVLRGPTTAQFWYPAKRIPGIASKLGVCHACQSKVSGESSCPACHTLFEVEGDRQTLGLMAVRMIPSPGSPDANGSSATDAPVPAAEARPVAPPTRVLGSFAVPSVAETRLRADLAAARRRSTLLLAALALVILVGVIAIGIIATSSDKIAGDRTSNAQAAVPRESRRDPVAPPPQPSATQTQPSDQLRSSPPDPNPSAVPSSAPAATPLVPPAAAPSSGTNQPASPKPSDADLQVLRRTKLP